MNWYRAVVSKTGLKSVDKVDSGKDGDGDVFYLQAKNKADAAAAAKLLHRQRQRVYQNARRAELAQRNRCRCGRMRDLSGVTCSHCLERKREAEKCKRRGVAVPKRDESARVRVMQEQKKKRAAEAELEILLNVQKAYDKNPAEFKKWLNSRVSRLAKKAGVATLHAAA